MVIFDTDVIIDIMHNDAAAVGIVQDLLDANVPMSISVITRMQLFHGVARSRLPDWERRKISQALRGFVEHPVLPDLAEAAGTLDGELVLAGARLDPFDTIIAATALVHREPLVTRNRDDFARIPGLTFHPLHDKST